MASLKWMSIPIRSMLLADPLLIIFSPTTMTFSKWTAKWETKKHTTHAPISKRLRSVWPNASSKLVATSGAKIILYKVQDPDRYGVAKFNKNNKIVKIIEKPKKFISNYAVTGIYFYDNKVINYAKKLKPSNRNELEITDINNYYVKESNLEYFKIKPGGVWLDAGTEKSLLQSSLYIQTIQERQNIQISSPEIIAYNNGWISKKKLISSVTDIKNSYTSFIKIS